MNKYSLLVGVFSVVGIWNMTANSEENTDGSADNTEIEIVETGRIARAEAFLGDAVKNTGEWVGDYVGSFCKETISKHPIALTAAGSIKAWHSMNPRHHVEFNSARVYESATGTGTKTTNVSSLLTRSIKSTRFPLILVGYSVGNTIYNRLKK